MKKKPRPPVTPPPEPNEPKALLSGILGSPYSPTIDEKPNLGSLVEKGRRLLKPLKELNEGHARGDRLVTSKEFYDLYIDGPSSKWCPDSPGAVELALKRLGMVPVIRGSKGRGKSHKWWELEAKERLIMEKLKH